jgi:hypothetical protein
MDQGIARLVDALARRGDAAPEELCDLLLAEVGLAHNDDDIALLALRPGGPTSSASCAGRPTRSDASSAPLLDNTAV